tara:strand:+ start:11 stop:397 length:387 start_codon:yes stop_codon:yes gene_type:complete
VATNRAFVFPILSHFVLALFACLTVKDSFSLPVQRKKTYYLLALLLPFLGSIIAFKKVSQSKSRSNAYSSGVYIGVNLLTVQAATVVANSHITRRSNGQKTVGCFTPFTILANNFLPLNVALCDLGGI